MEVEWGVFVINRNRLDEIVHIVPVISGAIMNPHKLSVRCSCHPEVEDNDSLLVTHNMIN